MRSKLAIESSYYLMASTAAAQMQQPQQAVFQRATPIEAPLNISALDPNAAFFFEEEM